MWAGQPAEFGTLGISVAICYEPSDAVAHIRSAADPEFHLDVAWILDVVPEGWTAQAATEPWTGAQANFGEPPATGLIGAADCNVAAVTTEGRGYVVALYTSGDEAWLSTTHHRAWFEGVLATVQLHPEDAVD